MFLTSKAWEAYKKWRGEMEREHGQMIYAPAAPRAAVRVRFDGPILLDRPSPDMWTVIDPSSPYYRRSLCLDSLISLGFTAQELNAAKTNGGN